MLPFDLEETFLELTGSSLFTTIEFELGSVVLGSQYFVGISRCAINDELI